MFLSMPATSAPTARSTCGCRPDEDTDFLFVRGPEKKVDDVEKLIESFDRPADEIEKQEFGDVHLFPLSNEKGQQVQTVLAQLGLQSQMLRLGETALIAIHADKDKEDQLKQAEQVIEKLAGENDEDSEDQDAENDSE